MPEHPVTLEARGSHSSRSGPGTDGLTRRSALGLLGVVALGAAQPPLEDQWRSIAGSDGTLGVSAVHLESGRRASLHGSERFPMASVCKLPLAMHFLALVDEGKRRLDERIEVLPRDVAPAVTPLGDRWPAERSFVLDEMLEAMVAQSDNTAVDCLLRLGGGPAAMAARFRQWRVEGMRIDRSEAQAGLDAAGIRPVPPEESRTREKRREWHRQATPAMRAKGIQELLADPRDTATPDGAVELLARLFRGEVLSKRSTARMIQILEATRTGRGRLRGLLPAGTVVAHKTGTTGDGGGINGSTNDAGVITLPGSRGRLVIAVFYKGSRLDDDARDRVIARTAKAAFDAFAG